MSQTKIIVSVVIVAAVAIGGYYLLHEAPMVTEQGNATTTSVTSGKKVPFAEFVKQGGSYKCDVNQSVGGIDTKGVTYINQGMIRGEYSTKTQGMTVGTTLIVRDGYTYAWSSLAPTMGFKSKVVAEAKGDVSAPTKGTYSFQAEQIGDYSCEPWPADTSMFAIPSGVTFREMK